MFLANWSFDMQYGTREETLGVIKELEGEFKKTSGWKAKNTKVLWGSIGVPESRITLQHEFDTLADLESSWNDLHKNGAFFKQVVSRMKPLVISGSPRWEIYRVVG
jgi:hypothetical protein